MSANMNEIYLIRHGETEWSRGGQHTGRTDIPLTEVGRQQAEKVIPLLAGLSFDRVLTSPLQRASDTAKLAGLTQAEPCDDLMEWDYGDFEGRTSVEISKDVPNWSIWDSQIPNGETIEEVAIRCRRVLAQCQQGRSALVAHGHLLRVLAACWLGQEPREGRRLMLSTASLSVLGWEHQTHVIRLWNQQG